jgi:hypothetical protein
MKKPRVDDFIANAAPPLSSPIDNYPKIEKSTPVVQPSRPPGKSPVSPSTIPREQPEQHQSPQYPSEQLNPPRDTTHVLSSLEHSNERTNVATNERTNVRTKIRHTFDIYADQLMSLRQIALKREATFGKRTLLGDLAQEALDLFLTKERNKE